MRRHVLVSIKSIKNKDSLICKTDEDSTYILAYKDCYNYKIKYFQILKKRLIFYSYRYDKVHERKL